MESSLVLQHHGIKGMRWSIRRFQNKDGSLTPLGRKHTKDADGEKKEETPEERRARALNSTDAREIYKNRDVLSTAEINERLNRIDTEVRLAKVAGGTVKSGMDRVDSVIKVARKANEVYELTNTPLGKAVKKALGGKVEEHMSPDLKKVVKNMDKMTDEQLTKVLKRASTEKTIKKMMEEYEAEKTKAKPESKDMKEESDKTNTFTGTVEGEGTSRYTRDSGPTVDAQEGRDYWNVNSDHVDRSNTSTGQSYVTALLEDRRRGGR